MHRGVIYGREIRMQGSPYTLLVYRHAFGSDLMRDLASAYGQDQLDEAEEDARGMVPDVSIFLQIAWAMARTWTDEVPDYPDWLRSFDPREFSLEDGSTLGVIDSAIAAELFRHRKAGRIRRWICKCLERVGEYARLGASRLRA